MGGRGNLILYHSTFRSRLPSIRKLGLGAKQIKNWDFSEANVVCLTSNAEVAFSFCESADEVAESVYESGIIVLGVSYGALDGRLLRGDLNIRNDMRQNGVYYFTYRGIIRPSQLFVVTREKGIVKPLIEMSRVPSYE